MSNFYSNITIDFPILWLLLSLLFLYAYRKLHWNRSLNLAGVFAIFFAIGMLPDDAQYIVILGIFASIVWSTRMALCDLFLGLLAPLFLSKYRRLQFGTHIGKIEHFYLRHFCMYTTKNEKIYIPYHHYLTQEFRILDSIAKTYTFPLQDTYQSIRIQRVKDYLYDSPFNDSDKWDLEVQDKLYVRVQLFREEDTVLLQEILHHIFYQPVEVDKL
jgi:hypothetical protein